MYRVSDDKGEFVAAFAKEEDAQTFVKWVTIKDDIQGKPARGLHIQGPPCGVEGKPPMIIGPHQPDTSGDVWMFADVGMSKIGLLGPVSEYRCCCDKTKPCLACGTGLPAEAPPAPETKDEKADMMDFFKSK